MQSRNISTSIYLFLFNDTPTTDIYTLSLHDALPISESLYEVGWLQKPAGQGRASLPLTTAAERSRSEEHTSELQSRLHLVCRLLLEKKNLTSQASLRRNRMWSFWDLSY